MPARLRHLLALAGAFCAACGPDPSAAFWESDTRFRAVRESLYNQVTVERTGNEVEMRFRMGRKTGRQTAVDLSDPVRLVIPYTRFMVVGALVAPQPKRVLQIGLGGGALNRFLRKAYPEARLTTVELDPVVYDMAREYMGFAPDEKDQVRIEDGRTFFKRDSTRWDWILVDAFRDGSVPPHLKTREFYELLRTHLAPGGVVVFNLHGGNKLFASDKATLKTVFPEVHLFGVPGTGNVIALACETLPSGFPKADRAPIAARSQLSEVVEGHLANAVREYLGPVEPSAAAVLTDDFAPAEFLQQTKD